MAGRQGITKLETDTVIYLPRGDGWTPQSCAYINDSNILIACSYPDNHINNFIRCDMTNRNYKTYTNVVRSGHASGCTYCDKNNLIYVTNVTVVTALNASTLKKEFEVILPNSAVGLAYDRITTNFYASSGGKIYVYPFSAFEKGGKYTGSVVQFSVRDICYPIQDIGGYNGIVITSTSTQNTGRAETVYADCFDTATGKLVHSYSIQGELESIVIDSNNYIYALIAQKRILVKTKNKFDLSGKNSSRATTGGTTLGVYADRLYRSDDFTYIDANYKEEKPKSTSDALKEIISSIDFSGLAAIPDTYKNVSIIASGKLDTSKLRKTKVSGELLGTSFPIALNPVEAPFIQLTIGEYTFGTYDGNKYDKYPNYIDSINIIKTNGSMNEYTINLVHQIRPGSNPNFIDELLSKNGYNKIKIKYGDANSDVKFIDENALLVGVSVSFDFVNCNIRYTLKATSNAISIASRKRTFKSVTDKPSNIIRDLLYNDSNNDLLDAFPRMRDKNFVASNNLIPNDDKVLTVEAFKDINAVTYLKNLVSAMQNSSDAQNSNYMLLIEDGYFSIRSINSSYSYDASLYEVNINFPDNNQIFSFNINTNYSWPIAYDYDNKISNYNYEINSDGEIDTFRDTSSQLLEFSSQMQNSINANWWKQVVDFPISATLTCRGLLSPQLLLSYVKINCVYYGMDRITSGIYIITGQQDSLSGSGYKTTLSLLRVAGPKEHLTVNGSVKT